MPKRNRSEHSRKMCPECAKHPSKDFSASEFDSVPVLRVKADLEQWEFSGDAYTHRANGVLAQYIFVDPVQCSFPDHTKHWTGSVITTPCGRIVHIGDYCGRRYIENYMAIKKGLQSGIDRASERSLLLTTPAQLTSTLRGLELRAEKQSQFRRRLPDLLPAFARAVARVKARNGEVEVPQRDRLGEDGKMHKQPPKSEFLVAYEIFQPNYEPRDFKAIRDGIDQLIADISVDSALAEPGPLYRRLCSLQQRIKRVGEGVKARDEFFSDRNLMLLVVATNQGGGNVPDGLKVVGGEYRFSIRGEEHLLGFHGHRRMGNIASA
ncbi:MAG: hypothetical protein JST92_26835 [Deltaproteobacteria bacterium]|nr:hypothetical protein [Deltaproteobacteria bacterium]